MLYRQYRGGVDQLYSSYRMGKVLADTCDLCLRRTSSLCSFRRMTICLGGFAQVIDRAAREIGVTASSSRNKTCTSIESSSRSMTRVRVLTPAERAMDEELGPRRAFRVGGNELACVDDGVSAASVDVAYSPCTVRTVSLSSTSVTQ